MKLKDDVEQDAATESRAGSNKKSPSHLRIEEKFRGRCELLHTSLASVLLSSKGLRITEHSIWKSRISRIAPAER
jgi:hypothetical protein